MRDDADHQHTTHDHAFGVGAAHEAGHLADPLAGDSSSGGLHEGLTQHIGTAEPHAGSVLGHFGPDHAVDHHDPLTVDDHAHLGDGGGGHCGLGIEHHHADGLSGLHDSIHESGLGLHGDEHHGLGEGLHIAHDHPDAHSHGHDLGDILHH
jgi:hypothetical protein